MRLYRNLTYQLVVTLAAVALGAPACGDDDDDGSPDAGFDSGAGGQGGTGGGGSGGSGGSGDAGPSDGGAQDGQAADAGMLSDSEIVAVMTAVNDGEIQTATLAMATSADTDVTTFANRMITDHGNINQMLVSLSLSESLPPLENAVSELVRAASSNEQGKLMTLSGIEFDQAYLEAQVEDHMQALTLIDETLRPEVSDSMLKSLLKSMRSTEAKHLSRARNLVDQGEADGGAEDGGM